MVIAHSIGQKADKLWLDSNNFKNRPKCLNLIDCFIAHCTKSGRIQLIFLVTDDWYCHLAKCKTDKMRTLFKNTQTNTLCDDTKLGKKKTVYHSLRFTATKRNTNTGTSGDQTWICLKSSSTQTSSQRCTRRHKRAHTLTYSHTAAVLHFFENCYQTGAVCLRVCVLYLQYTFAHMCSQDCTIPWPAIWLDPQRGCGSVTFTFWWRFSLSAVPCCY